MSRRTLENQFKDRLGHSPGQEIQRIKLAKAKQLLADSSLSVTRVAELTGFAEHSGLTTFFRTRTGMTPTAYRKQEQGE